MIVLPIFLQMVLEYDAMQAGLSIAPLSLSMFAVAMLMGRRAGSHRPAGIIRLGFALVAVGIAIGVVGTVALARLLTSFLYGVDTVDPVSFVAASAVLLLIGMVAAFVPARRASTVDPALVLREQ
jgi:ABC-type lipoprotein release transport system permease subunit